MLTESHQRALLQLARAAIAARVDGRSTPTLGPVGTPIPGGALGRS